jgi:hypothetical protein
MQIQPPFDCSSIRRTPLKRLVLLVILVSTVSASATAAAFDRLPDSAEIRAGYNIAVTTCVACHIVSPHQTIPTIEGGTVPSFQEIGNRPSSTLESVGGWTKDCSGTAARFLRHCSPFDHISDRERRQVAAYILSLRSPR